MVIPFVDGRRATPFRPELMSTAQASDAAPYDDDLSQLACAPHPAGHKAGSGCGSGGHSRGLEELAASLTRFLSAFRAHFSDFIHRRAGDTRLCADGLRLAQHFRQMRAIGFPHFVSSGPQTLISKRIYTPWQPRKDLRRETVF